MDKVTEQLIRIEAKLELLIDIIKAKNSETKEVISYEEYHRRRDKMAEDMANR